MLQTLPQLAREQRDSIHQREQVETFKETTNHPGEPSKTPQPLVLGHYGRTGGVKGKIKMSQQQ